LVNATCGKVFPFVFVTKIDECGGEGDGRYGRYGDCLKDKTLLRLTVLRGRAGYKKVGLPLGLRRWRQREDNFRMNESRVG